MNYSKAKNHRVQACDGLRAIALLGVIAYHVWPNHVPGGYLGVNIFFVLAGFFISQQIYTSLARSGQFNLLSYYRKRFLRLYAPLIPLLILVNLWTYFMQPSIYANVQESTPSVLFFYNNIYQLLGDKSYFATHGNFQPFTHMWALAIEVQFYLLYPLLLLLLTRLFRGHWRKVGAALLGLSLFSAIFMAVRYQPGVDPTPIYYSLLCRLFAFTIGGATAIYYLATPLAKHLQAAISQPRRNLLALVSLVIIVTSFFFMGYQNNLVYQGGMFIYSLLIAACIILIYPGDAWVAQLLSGRFLHALSRRSYSYYLWQYCLMTLGDSWFAFSTTPIALRRLLHFVLLLVIGEISYRLFEQQTTTVSSNRSRRLLLVACMLLIVCTQINMSPAIAVTPPDYTGPPSQPSTDNSNKQDPSVGLQQLHLVAIGDSVLDMAADQLRQSLPKCTIDAKISRQIGQGVETLTEHIAGGTTGDAYLISLGTNGDFKETVLDQYYQLAAGRPLILLTTVMPDSWEQSVNNKIRRYAAANPGVYVVDWYALAKNHPEWFYNDGTHPRPEGVCQLVDLILQQLEATL